MAEKGAHLTTTLLSKPSIFDVIAQDTLAATFQPATKRFIQFLVTRNPERYGWLSRWFDEVFLLTNSVLQIYYLHYNGGSFSETFYGLQRSCLKDGSLPGKLQRREWMFSVFFLCVFPYLRTKVEELSIKYQLEEVDGAVVYTKWQQRVKRTLIQAHRVLHLSFELWTLAQYLRYMAGKSNAHSPTLTLSGLTLCYTSIESGDFSWSDLWQSVSSGRFRLVFPTMSSIGSALTSGLEFVAFFIQFLQWWHSEQTHTDITALPVPDPPKHPEIANRFAGVCPLCRNPWKVETLLSVSGFVYCYRCIQGHLKKYSSCPVTHYPASIQDLVRIYPTQS